MARYKTEKDITAVSIGGVEYEVKDGVLEADESLSGALQELGFVGALDEDHETPETTEQEIKKGSRVSLTGPNGEAVVGFVTSKMKSGLVKVTDDSGTVWSIGIDSVKLVPSE